MTDLQLLLDFVAVPAAPVTGDLVSARSVVEKYIRLPADYWDVLSQYGSGYFYGDLDGVSLINPCEPDFSLRIAIDINAVQAAMPIGLASLDAGQRWIPVGNFGDVWVLLVEEGPLCERVLFACTRADEEFFLATGGIADVIRRIVDEDLHIEIFGAENSVALTGDFTAAQFQLLLDREYLRVEAADAEAEFLIDLAAELEPVWNMDLLPVRGY